MWLHNSWKTMQSITDWFIIVTHSLEASKPKVDKTGLKHSYIGPGPLGHCYCCVLDSREGLEYS